MPSPPTHNPCNGAYKSSVTAQELNKNLLHWSKGQENNFYITKAKLIEKGLVDQEGFVTNRCCDAPAESLDVTHNIDITQNINQNVLNLFSKYLDITCQLLEEYQSFMLLIVFIGSVMTIYDFLRNKFLNFKSNNKELPVPGIRCPRCYERGIETYVLRGKRCPRCNEQC